MAEHRTSPRDGGFVTAQFVVVVALSLLFFTMMANVIVFMYGRGVVRAALEEGVRAGSPARASAATCQRAARETMRSLLGGSLGGWSPARRDLGRQAQVRRGAAGRGPVDASAGR